MHWQIKALVVLSLSPLLWVRPVAAEPAIGNMPDTFPGSGGLPGPGMPSDLPPAYPAWPERSFQSEIIPPPPGGPYMSSAMTGITTFPENTGGLRHEAVEPAEPSPFFSEDMPWPETAEHDRPLPWVPDSGEYRYVPEDIVRELESTSPIRRPQHPMYQPFPRYPPPPPMRPPYFGYY